LDYHDIVDALRKRKDQIQEAISALQNHSKTRRKSPRRKRRKLSDAAKRRISEAMKLRWEQRKKQN